MPHKYLGGLGSKLPELTEETWTNIFEFVEFFVITEQMLKSDGFEGLDFRWNKVREILKLLNKVKENEQPTEIFRNGKRKTD